jgi:hypothetical protein
MPKSDDNYRMVTSITNGGTGYVVDKTESSDRYLSTFKMFCNQSKAAALTDHIVNTVRGNDVNIIGGANSNFFGANKASSGTYTCKLYQSKVTVTHNRPDEFLIPLTFFFKSVT